MKGVFKALSGSAKPSGKPSNKNTKLMDSINLDESQILSADKVSTTKFLGAGGFAKVYMCEAYGQVAVAKVIDAAKLNEEMTYLLTNECTIWASLAHPNIVSFHGMCQTPAAVMLVCEFMAGGSLAEHLQRKKAAADAAPSQMSLIKQLQQIADGMQYLHKQDPPVLHRDLKSANILLEHDGEGSMRLAIADLGLARYQAEAGKKMTAETGSYRWMAPEVIRHEVYDKRCDVYSFAILAWEMVTYRIPFDNMMPVEAAFAVAREARRPPIPKEWQALPVAEMLRACWHQDAVQRPPFSAICPALAEELELLSAQQTGVPDI